jgi:predicted tellurium resistance membrane protein TerC
MLDQLLDSPNFGLETLLVLPVLIALEAVLSADNAIALAALAQGLEIVPYRSVRLTLVWLLLTFSALV